MGERKKRPVDGEAVAVFPDRREIIPRAALFLDPQHHHHIGVLDPLADVVMDSGSHHLEFPGDQRRRPDQADAVPHLLVEDDVRTGHPGMENVADDGDLQSPQGPEPLDQ